MGTFAWMRAKQLEIIVLNDFCWSASIIPCSDFLQMLERDIVHLPALKRHWIHKGHAILGHGRHSISLSKGWVHWSDQHSNDVSLLAMLSLLEANSRKGSSMSHSLSEMFWETYYRYQMKPPHIFLSPLPPLRNWPTGHDGFSTVLHKKCFFFLTRGRLFNNKLNTKLWWKVIFSKSLRQYFSYEEKS